MAEEALARAQALVKAKDYVSAIDVLNTVVEEGPSNAHALAARAQVHNKLEDHMEAVADASAAVELDPRLALAWKEKGMALFSLEEYEGAKEAFERTAVMEPTKRIHRDWVRMCQGKLGEEQTPEEAAPSVSGAGPAAGMPPALGGLLAQRGAPPAAAPPAGAATSARADDPEWSKYWRAPVAAAAVAAAAGPQDGARYRHQWFQSEQKVEVSVLAKGLAPEAVQVNVEPRRLRVVVAGSKEGEEDYVLDLALAKEVVPAESAHSVLGSKVEVRLKKAAPGQWDALEGGGEAAEGEGGGAAHAAATTTPYPYAVKKVDWDKVEAAAKVEEKEEKLEGDAATMKFFRELFAGGDEDMKRAMMKSYQESGGTSLSTNWKDVGTKKYEMTAPEGAEVKKYEF